MEDAFKYNPFFEVTGIIASTWLGLKEIQNDFIMISHTLLSSFLQKSIKSEK